MRFAKLYETAVFLYIGNGGFVMGTSKNLPHGKFSTTLHIFRVSET